MGSSVSVMIAQYLSEKVAERILSHLISSRAALSGEFSVFVDDIFISWDPICSDVDVDELIDWAVRTTASQLNVTFKFCQIYIVGTSPMVNCLGDALRNDPTAYEDTGSFKATYWIVEFIPAIEIETICSRRLLSGYRRCPLERRQVNQTFQF